MTKNPRKYTKRIGDEIKKFEKYTSCLQTIAKNVLENQEVVSIKVLFHLFSVCFTKKTILLFPLFSFLQTIIATEKSKTFTFEVIQNSNGSGNLFSTEILGVIQWPKLFFRSKFSLIKG